MTDANKIFELIGRNLSKIRNERLQMTQEQLAEDLGMSRSFLSHIESPNVDVGVSIDTLFYIAQKYKIDIRDFFDGYKEFIEKETKQN